MWICPTCHAEIESEYGVCWRCRRTARSAGAVSLPAARRSPVAHDVIHARETCPHCGERSYRKTTARPWVLAALRTDRICTSCLDRFPQPTPAWALVAYLVSLGLIVATGIPMLVALFLPAGKPLWIRDVCLPVGFLAWMVFLLVVQFRD